MEALVHKGPLPINRFGEKVRTELVRLLKKVGLRAQQRKRCPYETTQ